MIPNMGRDDSLYQPPEHDDLTEIASGCQHETDLVLRLTQRGKDKTICRNCAVKVIQSTGKVIQSARYDGDEDWMLDSWERCPHCRKFECVCP